MRIWFATGNIHKKKELSGILISGIKRPGIFSAEVTGNALELMIPKEAGLAFDPEENGNTFLDNALIKARELHRILEESRPSRYKSGDPVIADDSGICVDALNGRPGIYSARYAGKRAAAGQKLTDTERNILLLEELADQGDNPPRGARFVCAMVLYYSSSRFFAVQETMEGELVKNTEEARGKGGFGYDPVLYIPELGRTVAELSDEEKNLYSHRGKAGRAIARLLPEF